MFEKTFDELKPDKAFRNFLIGLILFLSLFFVIMGGFYEWVLGLFVLALMCLLIVGEVSGRSRDMLFWKREDEVDSELNMNLKEVSKVAERAYTGKKVSKARLEERIIKEFLSKIKTERELSNDEVEEMLDEPKELRERIDDDQITEFILGSKSFTDIVHEKSIHEQPDTRWSNFKKKFKFKKETYDEEYKRKINNILKRMEEWN
ncbi:MAG: hypothetical protein ACOCSL_03060 [Thermoplasmatota archaeon]